jgi:hypothetical protein
MSTLPVVASLMTVNAWFLRRVRFQSNGCWDWMGPRSDGYGSCSQAKRLFGTTIASRVSHLLFVGPIPNEHDPRTPLGFQVRHRCDRPCCVNPEHLELGHPKDNSRDGVERGRHFLTGAVRAERRRISQYRQPGYRPRGAVPRRTHRFDFISAR